MTKIEILKTMVHTDQKNASAWFLLGLEYSELGDRGEALLAFTQALAYGDEELKNNIVGELNKLSQVKPLRNGGSVHEAGTFQTRDIHTPVTLRVIEGGKHLRKNKGEVRISTLDKNVSFAEVGGLQDVKEAVRMKIVQPFLATGLCKPIRQKPGSGVLLYGPPGCGKTFFAKATAGECNATLLHVKATDILDSRVGASEQNIRTLFRTARTQKPAILFFDELDALGYAREKNSSAWKRGINDFFFMELEGEASRADKLLIMGATNMPWDVDPGFHRPGCFDQLIFVGPPDAEAREIIFRLKLEGRPSEPIDFAQLAGWTDLYSGADIEYVVELATEQVLHDFLTTGVERPIMMSDLRESIAATRPTTIEWLRTAKNYVKYANDEGLYDGVEHFLAKHKRI
ncbi:hypothetical protein AN963_22485 [Brevibacillus choshinensis]|uniref:AAA+ ATPase domain-containing protein n=1 Tax=Brevibacillus choshinensis TaxID=54911 RepID=A0ABR5N145_BRECH|nr:AAA family ATPase [Brevibacillus choshinensis]KQL44196.1 hypothetical protein AN963_22485 [Brevibacillus choshinensis]